MLQKKGQNGILLISNSLVLKFRNQIRKSNQHEKKDSQNENQVAKNEGVYQYAEQIIEVYSDLTRFKWQTDINFTKRCEVLCYISVWSWLIIYYYT